MKWFQHDSNASSDSKIKKLIIAHGAEGYAVYFHCLELIAADINENHLDFTLEHDAEIIADNLKIQGSGSQSGRERVEEIMRKIIDLNLFQGTDGQIYCLQLARRITSIQIKNPNLKNIQMLISERLAKYSKNFLEKDRKFLLPRIQTIPRRLDSKSSKKFLEDDDEFETQVDIPEDETPPQSSHTPWDFATEWNSFTGLASFRHIRGNVPTTDLEDIRRHTQPYTHDEVAQAIKNFGYAFSHPETFENVPHYQSLVGFLKAGVEKFVGPTALDRYRIKRTQPVVAFGENPEASAWRNDAEPFGDD